MNNKIKLILKNAYKNSGTKSVIFMESFRAARNLLDEIVKLAETTDLIKAVKKSCDQYEIILNNSSVIFALPIGNSDRLCGYRANFCYLFGKFDEEFKQTVAIPFLSSVSNPVERERIIKLENEMIRLGILNESEKTQFLDSQLINFT